MSVIFLLLTVSTLVAGLFLLGFIWAVRKGQYDDDRSPAVRILFDDRIPATKDLRGGAWEMWKEHAHVMAPDTHVPSHPSDGEHLARANGERDLLHGQERTSFHAPSANSHTVASASMIQPQAQAIAP